MKGKLAFDWLIVLVTMTTPMSSHVFTARGEDIYFFFRREENPSISSVSTYYDKSAVLFSDTVTFLTLVLFWVSL